MSTNSEIWFEGKFCRVLLHFFRQSFPNLETVYEPIRNPVLHWTTHHLGLCENIRPLNPLVDDPFPY
jgi:hypothetical protein